MSAYPTPASLRSRRARLLAGCALAAAAATPGYAQFQANGVVVGGDATAVISPNSSLVTVRQDQVVINWTPTDTATSAAPINILPAGNVLRFDTELDGLSNYTVLNRVIPTDQSRAIQFNGTVESLVSPDSIARQGGNIWFYSPGGIIAGAGSRFDVGSLVLTTNDIDTTGGLFGANGAIRFRGAADSRSRVQVDLGSKIDARAELSSSNYVALIAPRVIQNGIINADGSVALIAATALDLTIPVNGGLFDIAVTAGSEVNTGGETILTHTGETYANDILETGAPRRVYMTAVSKNDAVTLLVSGKAGYDAAQGVQFGNGGLELVAGRSVAILDASGSDRQVTTGAGDSVQLGAATFNRAVRAQGAEFGLTLANGQALSLTNGLEAVTDRIAISTSGGSTATVGGAVNLFGKSIEMAIGGDFSIGSSLSASAKAFGSSGSLLTGGSIDITVNGGKLTSTFGLNLNAGANNSGGGDAQGGDVFLQASNGGSIETGYGITLDASARTEGGLGITGRASGGSLLVSADGGIISANGLSLAALGLADAGSSGTGGVIDVQARSNGQINLSSLGANARAASGEAGYGDLGGDAFGGSITLGASGTSKIVASGGISLSAVAFGDDQSESDAFGGSGTGGAVALLTADSATIETSGSLSVNVTGFGGEAGYGTGGGATGGKIELTSTGGGIIAGAILLSATAESGDGDRGGGGGTGGRIDMLLDGGALVTSDLTLKASALAGDAGSGSNAQSGAGIGGFVTLDSRAGSTLTFDNLDISSSGTGGAGMFFFAQNAFGGLGQGGEVTVKLAGTKLQGENAISIVALGSGGSGNTGGGSATGGTVALTVSDGTDLLTTGDVALFANAAGGSGPGDAGRAEGGQIAIRADGGALTSSSLDADASGDGGDSFGSGPGGDGIGGSILLESRAGGLIRGAGDFAAHGTGGDASPPFSAGLGKGGAIAVRIGGGTIDATGGTMRLDANGVGGFGAPIFALLSVGGPVLASGGTVDAEVGGGGQFLLTSLFGSATASYDDTGDGFAFENHGANAVGGTVRLALSSGKITADGIALEANGTGGNSPSGGEGGTGYQGRAEILMTGGEFTVTSLDVIARAFGGTGIDQSSEGDREAGSGGGAGLGTSPYGAGAGAYIGISGGTFQANGINLVAESTGGNGGDGDEFADVQQPRSGGSAVSAPAVFTVSDTGSAEVAALSIVTTGRGGSGGSLNLEEFSGSDAVAGSGGDGTGGLASVTLGGTGTIEFSFIQAQSDGRGGDAGRICTFFCGDTFGSGRGGDGGAGFGGGVNLTFNASLQPAFAVISADAQGLGGLGGEGPSGGNGGSGVGGSATLAFAGGSHDVFAATALAGAQGAPGARGLSGAGGRGGSAEGGNANLSVGDGVTLATRELRVQSDARGGGGGDGADDVSAAFNGGAGGAAAGGVAAVDLFGGSLTLFGSGEGVSDEIDAAATGGNGGSGGDTSDGTAGSGGDGGNASAGTARFVTQNASADLKGIALIADATSGGRGFAGIGLDGSDGDHGDAVGGLAELSLTHTDAPVKTLDFGFVTASADAGALFEEGPIGRAGTVSILAQGGPTAARVLMDGLIVSSLGAEPNGDGVVLSGGQASIGVASFVDVNATGSVSSSVTAGLALAATDFFQITAGGNVDLGAAAIGGGQVGILAGGRVSSAGGIFAEDTISIQALSGNAFVNEANAGGSVQVSASGDVEVGDLAGASADLSAGSDGSFGADARLTGAINVDGSLSVRATRDILIDAQIRTSGGLDLVSGDDILIGAGALLRTDDGPPPEFGYGGPLLLARAGAGGIDAGPLADGDIASLIVNGGIEFASGTVVLQGDSVVSTTGTNLIRAGNFYSNLTDVPPAEATPSNDLGQLSGACLQGSICLGTIAASGVVEIGGSSEVPRFVRFNPQIDAASVFVRGMSVQLGQAGVSSSLKASGLLQIEATNGDLTLLGALDIVGGSDFARITSTNDITGAANLSAPGTLDLFAGNNISLGTVSAQTIRTVGLDEVVIENSGINAAGKVEIGKLSYGADVRLIGGTGAELGVADLGANRLELFTKAGLARLGGGTLLDLNAIGDSVDVSVAATGDVFATAVDGVVALGTVTANIIDAVGSTGLSFADLTAAGLVRLDSQGAISGGSARGGTISVTTPGQLTAASLTTTSGGLSVTADKGIELASIAAQGAANLKAVNGAVSISTDAFATGDLTVQGASVSLTGANGLTVATATATDGDLTLIATKGAVNVESAGASKAATLTAAEAVTFADVNVGGQLRIEAGGALAGTTLVAASADLKAAGSVSVKDVASVPAGLTVSGTSVTLNGRNGLKLDQVTATAGDITLTSKGDLVADRLASAGKTNLAADGTVSVGTDIAASDGITATGKAVSLTALSGLNLLSANATGTIALKSGGLISASNLIAKDVTATGASVSLSATGPLSVTTATAAGDIALITTGGDLKVGTADAGGALTLASSGGIAFATLQSDKALTLAASGDVSGGSATAASIAITTPGAIVADDLIATAGTLSAIGARGVTVDTAISSGTTTLKADQGVVRVASDLRPGEGLIVSAPTIDLTGQTGLNIVEASATSGDLILRTVAGDLIAGKSTAAGAISLASAGALGFASLAAQQGVTLKAAGDVTGGSVSGTSVAVSAGGGKGLSLQSIAVSGPVTLGATAGAIQIGNVLTSAGVQATARSIELGSTGNMLLAQGSATDGDIALSSSGGGITLGQVSATKALNVEAAAGTLAVTGTVAAATIGFTSADIAIGSGAQVGSVSQTGTITFTSTAPRTFVGGTGTDTGYRLDAAELARVAARDGFTITTPPTQGSAAFSFVEPDQATIVLDSMTFSGAQLGTNGIFTVDAPRSIGIIGNVEYKNFAAGQSVIYRAGSDISLAAETGLVSLKDGAGALAGTLRLQAPQVTAMSVPARQEVPNLTLNQARQRLGTNDAVQNDGGYFQAGSIDVRIGRLLFVQNTGANSADIDGLRGFTGNSVRIEATGSSPAQVVLSGRVSMGSGFAVGDELASNITLVGSFDPDSSFGGCALGAASCGGPPPSVAEVTFSVARDQVRDEEEEDEQEEAIQASQTRPDPIIQFMTAPSSRLDPLIDEPITGAGNEDLWEAPTIPSPED